MPHQIFDHFNDSYVAEVFSEALEQKDYSFLTFDNQSPIGAGFPPVPANIVQMLGSYIQTYQGVPSRVRSKLAVFNNDLNLEQTINIYDKQVGQNQRMIKPGLLKITQLFDDFNSLEKIQKWYTDKAISNRHRLLAGFIIAKEIDGDRLFSALTYPSVIKQQLPLAIRDNIISFMPLLNELEKTNEIEETVTIAKQGLQTFIANDPKNEIIGALAASSFLPDTESFKNHITNTIIK